METGTIAPKSPRITIIDALRGFSLAGIVFAHMLEHFAGAPIPNEAVESMNPGLIDQIANAFVNIFFRGKFFALFSFLFGLSFFIQMDNADQKGNSFSARFLWRLILLLVIGYVHSLFYRGDILTIYALCGVLLIPFYQIRSKWVIAVMALLFLGLGRYIVFSFTNGDPLFLNEPFMPDSEKAAQYFELLKNGSLPAVFQSNAIEGHMVKMEAQFGIFSRGYLTFAFFLMGLLVGRIGLFKNFRERSALIKKSWITGLIMFVLAVGGMIGVFAALGPDSQFDNWLAMIGLTLFDLANVAMTIIIIAVFIILYKKRKPHMFLQQFAPYGRMALTNYVAQTIVGTAIFYGWGLGYLAQVRNSYVFLLAILVITLQVWFSKWWLKRFRYGPLEWLWRSATFMKWYPMRRK
ncbi:DUF418 domain-containing protein [Allomuricauda sp. SCSIO 65647]|uniref:DUF418 domain-containing protein n=1 Tax=Allomuricauda sp. SCSIO 65647 TaxID=2908843 RepID=UPI001F35E510|nr:DUF418 domain-containing protein [Muricauda sp. SCSIO 65647]UJH67266.1 DUF418 domain-containing protein [Muricauda sp. SCSIO 65647]